MRYAIFISAVVLVFCSCADRIPEKKLETFHSTLNSLEESSKKIQLLTADLHKEFYKKINDSRYSDKARIWYPLSDSISDLSTLLTGYIKDLKLKIIKECGYEINSNDIFKTGGFESVKKIFFEQDHGKHLYDSLKFFIVSICKTNLELNRITNQSISTHYSYLDYAINNSKEFLNCFFKDVSAAEALCSLAKIENDIANIENESVNFCFVMGSPGCDLVYETFSTVVSQSSNYVKSGDEIGITAGVGAFSTNAMPEFTIDDKKIKANEEGIMVYKFKTQFKAGTYNKPVTIEYTKPDGTRDSHTYSISYTVIDPNQK